LINIIFEAVEVADFVFRSELKYKLLTNTLVIDLQNCYQSVQIDIGNRGLI